jgi:hypothetical protein
MQLYSFISSTIIGLEPRVFYIVLACALVTLLAVILVIVFALKASKARRQRNSNATVAAKVKIHKGVRYSANTEAIAINDEMNISHVKGDFNVKKGELYTASRRGALLPGKYTILSTAGSEEKFNIRIGRYLREYSHGDVIVLPDGETIICPSHSIILR